MTRAALINHVNAINVESPVLRRPRLKIKHTVNLALTCSDSRLFPQSRRAASASHPDIPARDTRPRSFDIARSRRISRRETTALPYVTFDTPRDSPALSRYLVSAFKEALLFSNPRPRSAKYREAAARFCQRKAGRPCDLLRAARVRSARREHESSLLFFRVYISELLP